MPDYLQHLIMARRGLLAARRQTAESMANSTALAPALARRLTEQQIAIEALDRAVREEERILLSVGPAGVAVAKTTQAGVRSAEIRTVSPPRRMDAPLQLNPPVHAVMAK
jgi:hypothetical protein